MRNACWAFALFWDIFSQKSPSQTSALHTYPNLNQGLDVRNDFLGGKVSGGTNV